MSSLKDLTGQRFGRLVVLARDMNLSDGQARWRCRCDCGKETRTSGGNLRRKATLSCGCMSHEKFKTRVTLHGKCGTPEYGLWKHARRRARELHLPFDLSVSDIVIPTMCPVLRLPLIVGKNKPSPNSPSLDRIIPTKGYVKGNVWVLSHRANRMKGTATLCELQALIDGMVHALAGNNENK